MERKKFIDFQKYGYFIGGLVPILITSLLSLLTSHKVFDSKYLGFFLISSSIGTSYGFLVFLFYSENRPSNIFINFFLIQAFLSGFLIHLWVAFSGGAIESIFSLSYLYLPAVVGYTFGKSKELYIASFFLGVSFFLNTFYCKNQMETFDFIATIGGERINHEVEYISNNIQVQFSFFVIFLAQLIVTIIMAKKRDSW